METVEVEIINPKAKKLLNDLADLELISIRKSTKNDFFEVLKKIRDESDTPPGHEEILREVETVRSRRYNRQ